MALRNRRIWRWRARSSENSGGACYNAHVDSSAREVIGVAELDRRLRRSVEAATGGEWVQGEVGTLRRVTAGHVYFTLKDEVEDALIECVVYRFQAQRFGRFLTDGGRVQLLGKATVWAPRGRLQFVAETVRPVGRGALLEALLRLKEKLAAEGLFEPTRKRALPERPRVIAVITSAQGAAWHDIRTVALRRAPLRLVLVPAVVQGEGAVESLLRALDRAERLPHLDAIILGRGGGSFEDLMAFNDERLARRVASCGVPVVSAVGHEIDTSLCDLVADARAATPSEAAELLVPDEATRIRKLGLLRQALRRAMGTRLMEDRSTLGQLDKKLSDPRFVIAEKQQLLDDYTLRLERRARRSLALARQRTSSLHQRLSSRHPRTVLMRAKLGLAPMEGRLQHAMQRALANAAQALQTGVAQLDALSPLAVLARGYAIALTDSGEAVRSVSRVAIGDVLRVRVHDGALGVRVDSREVGS